MAVEPQWTDYNGHLNMAYYNVLFDRAVDQFLDALGVGEAYARTRRMTIYAAEIHLSYLRELHQDAEVFISVQLLEHDEKRIRFWKEMRHRDGWLAATSEALSLHVDMAGPKVAPFPPDRLAEIERMQAVHGALPWPARAGRSISLMRRAAKNPITS